MAKSSSPVRLQDKLMQEAVLTGKRYHRSAAQQIEYWAEIGRATSQVLTPDELLRITTGLASIHVDSVDAKPIDSATVFQSLEEQRDNNTLSQAVSQAATRYQASRAYPGLLEQIDARGKSVPGQFINGKFVPKDELDR